MEEKYRKQGIARFFEVTLVIVGSPFVFGRIIYYWQFDRWVSSGEMTKDHFVRACVVIAELIGNAAYILINTLLRKRWRNPD
jgi:hypothetical protein